MSKERRGIKQSGNDGIGANYSMPKGDSVDFDHGLRQGSKAKLSCIFQKRVMSVFISQRHPNRFKVSRATRPSLSLCNECGEEQ